MILFLCRFMILFLFLLLRRFRYLLARTIVLHKGARRAHGQGWVLLDDFGSRWMALECLEGWEVRGANEDRAALPVTAAPKKGAGKNPRS